MKPISEALKARLRRVPSTVCNCWILRRTDGVVFGFTDHDREVTAAGVVCEPEAGMIAGLEEHSAGLAGDSSPVEGALTSDRITAADIEAGFFDGAYLDRYVVDWEQPNLNAKLGRSLLGEVTIKDGEFSVEMRSASALLERNLTRHFSSRCDAEFGDARCGINALGSTYSTTVTVQAVVGDTIELSSASGLSLAKYTSGQLLVTTDVGERRFHVRQLGLASTGAGYAADVVGDGLPIVKNGQSARLVEGCDKRFATCRDRFGNAARFRGFPHFPTAEKALNYVDEEGVFDGSPIVP